MANVKRVSRAASAALFLLFAPPDSIRADFPRRSAARFSMPHNASKRPTRRFLFYPHSSPPDISARLCAALRVSQWHIREGCHADAARRKGGNPRNFQKKFAKISRKNFQKKIRKSLKVAKSPKCKVAKVAKNKKTPPKVVGRRKSLESIIAHNAPKTPCEPFNPCGAYLSCLRTQTPLCPAYTSPGAVWT